MTRPATQAEIDAVLETLRSGWLTMGPRTQAFEAAFADRAGEAHAVAAGSYAAAIHLAYLAVGVGERDRVVLPAGAPRVFGAAAAWCGAVAVSDGPGDFTVAAGPFRGRIEGVGGPVAGFHSLDEGAPLSVGLGGVVTTGDESVARRARLLRGHALTSGTWDRHRGHSAGYDVVDVGFNYRLDEARAALALAKLSSRDVA